MQHWCKSYTLDCFKFPSMSCCAAQKYSVPRAPQNWSFASENKVLPRIIIFWDYAMGVPVSPIANNSFVIPICQLHGELIQLGAAKIVVLLVILELNNPSWTQHIL